MKSFYLILCSNAVTRPTECTELAKAMQSLIAYNKFHSAYKCPFNIVEDFTRFTHDEGVLITPEELAAFAAELCTNQIVRTEEDYDNLKTSLEERFVNGGKEYFALARHNREHYRPYYTQYIHSAVSTFRTYFFSKHPQKYFIYQRQLP